MVIATLRTERVARNQRAERIARKQWEWLKAAAASARPAKCPVKCFTQYFPETWSRMQCAKWIERTPLEQGVNFGYISTNGRRFYIEVRL